MKRIKIIKAALVCSCLLLFLACKKEKTKLPDTPEPVTTELKPGLPANKGSIHGYFYVSNDVASMPNPFFYNVNFYAVLNDPARNLIGSYDHVNNIPLFNSFVSSVGNVSVGIVSFGGFPVQAFNFGNSLTYRNSFSPSNLNSLGNTWTTQGNSTFKPINEIMSRGFPTVVNSGANYSLSLSNGYTVNIGNGFISNYDSVIVSIEFGPNTINKRGGAGTSKLVFTPADLSLLSAAWSPSIRFMAFNYSSRTIADKVYVFEMASKVNASLYVTP